MKLENKLVVWNISFSTWLTLLALFCEQGDETSDYVNCAEFLA
jgi:hypothetical protein